MKHGDLVRLKREWMKGSIRLSTDQTLSIPTPSGKVFQNEPCLLLEVKPAPVPHHASKLLVLTPRGEVGWNNAFEFERVE